MSDDILYKISACILHTHCLKILDNRHIVFLEAAVTNVKSLDDDKGRCYQTLYRT
jgi:hypothetical protein